MKKLTILLIFISQITLHAQTGFKWQGLAKDATGNPVTQPVTLTFSILQNGAVVYSETQASMLPVNGQLTATVGMGTPLQGTFSAIDWSVAVSLNVKMQVGGGAVVDMGTSEILPVPVATYAMKSGDNAWSSFGQGIFYTDGKVGIGTENPFNDLHIASNNELSQVYLERKGTNAGHSTIGGSSEGFTVGHYDTNGNWGSDFNVGHDGQVRVKRHNAVAQIRLERTGSLAGNATIGGSSEGFTVGHYDNNGNWGSDFNVSHNGVAKTKILEITGGSDITEKVNSPDDLQPGEVIVTDPSQPNCVRRSSRAYDRTVLGVVSGAGGVSHGMELKQEGLLDGNISFAIVGRVYVKTTGKVAPGDLLTTSNVPGHAMRATNRRKRDGAVIGKALTAPNEEGLVLMLVQTR